MSSKRLKWALHFSVLILMLGIFFPKVISDDVIESNYSMSSISPAEKQTKVLVAADFSRFLDSDWQLSRDVNDVMVWQLKSNSDVTGTYQTETRDRPIDWSVVTTDDFFKSLENNKKQLLGLIGISEWNAASYLWQDKGDQKELMVRGTYKNSGGQLVQFVELHTFDSLRTTQILYTQPADVKLAAGVGKKFVMDMRKAIDIR